MIFCRRTDTLDGRNPANQLRLIVYPIKNNRVLKHPNGGFSPDFFQSTVLVSAEKSVDL